MEKWGVVYFPPVMDLSKCVEKIITLCEDMDIEDLAEPEQVFVYFDDAYTLFKQSSEYVELEKKIKKDHQLLYHYNASSCYSWLWLLAITV